MIYDLPTSVEIGGASYEIRSDYRAVLDILTALSDPELSDSDRAEAILDIFYFHPTYLYMPQSDYDDAIRKFIWFINCGNEEKREKKQTKLMDWEQDFPYIVAPVNRVLGLDVRSVPYDFENNTGGLHWWTFMSAYQEIGDCLFAQIVGIRRKLARGKKLDKSEQEFYRNNRQLVDFKRKYTEMENDILSMWVK